MKRPAKFGFGIYRGRKAISAIDQDIKKGESFVTLRFAREFDSIMLCIEVIEKWFDVVRRTERIKLSST